MRLRKLQWVDTVAAASPDWPMKQVVFCDLTAPDRRPSWTPFRSCQASSGSGKFWGAAPKKTQNRNECFNKQPQLLDGLRDVADRGLLVDLQLTSPLIEAAGELFAKVPHLPVALCHAGSPHDRSTDGLDAWAKALPQLATLPNMVCKLPAWACLTTAGKATHSTYRRNLLGHF